MRAIIQIELKKYFLLIYVEGFLDSLFLPPHKEEHTTSGAVREIKKK